MIIQAYWVALNLKNKDKLRGLHIPAYTRSSPQILNGYTPEYVDGTVSCRE